MCTTTQNLRYKGWKQQKEKLVENIAASRLHKYLAVDVDIHLSSMPDKVITATDIISMWISIVLQNMIWCMKCYAQELKPVSMSWNCVWHKLELNQACWNIVDHFVSFFVNGGKKLIIVAYSVQRKWPKNRAFCLLLYLLLNYSQTAVAERGCNITQQDIILVI